MSVIPAIRQFLDGELDRYALGDMPSQLVLRTGGIDRWSSYRRRNAEQSLVHEDCSARVRSAISVGGIIENLPDSASAIASLGVSHRVSDTSSEQLSAVWF